MAVARRFLILHGLSGSGPEHWQSWLAGRLRERGEKVAYPDLPDPDEPRLAAWLAALGPLRGEDDVVVCHSLACLLWLHHRAAGGPVARRVLLVAPPSEDADVPEIMDFFPVALDPALAEGATLLCSDDDPYCPDGAAGRYGDALQVPTTVIPGGGHLNTEAGLGPWPDVERWALDA